MRAALLEGTQGAQAWAQWRREHSVESVDHASFKLLPALYRNLTGQGSIQESLDPRLKGAYRSTWVQNQVLLRGYTSAVTCLNGVGITPLALKGAALVGWFRADKGGRPMHDIDLMVRPEQVPLASRALCDAGWRIKQEIPDGLRAFRREQVFVNSTGIELDLHWHLLAEWCLPSHDEKVWGNITTESDRGLHCHVPNPNLMLVHLCGHGYQWSPVPSHQWIVDAYRLVQEHGTELDWEEVLILSSLFEIRHTLRHLLEFLAHELQTNIPEAVLASLAVHSDLPTQVQRQLDRATTPDSVFPLVRKHWAYYAIACRREKRRASWAGFAHYFCLHFQEVWNLPTWWSTPLQATWILATRRNRARLQSAA